MSSSFQLVRSGAGPAGRPWGLTKMYCHGAACVKNEALLIKAQSRIVQLESELSRLRQEATVEKLKQVTRVTGGAEVTDVERQHKVQEMCIDYVSDDSFFYSCKRSDLHWWKNCLL